MSALPEREYLAEEICDLYTRLTGGDYSEDLRRARELAEEEGPQDHWLLTNHLDYESRLFLYAAVAYSLRCMKRGVRAQRSGIADSRAALRMTARGIPSQPGIPRHLPDGKVAALQHAGISPGIKDMTCVTQHSDSGRLYSAF